MSDGTLSDGTLSDGPLSDGPLSDGTLSDGTLIPGPGSFKPSRKGNFYLEFTGAWAELATLFF